MLAVWVIGGIISLCGALSVAELAASLPQTGGWYVFLREGWGRLAGFLFGWSELVLIRASAAGAHRDGLQRVLPALSRRRCDAAR